MTRDEILKWAAFHKAEVVEMELPSQFRCNGSDGYLAWLDHLLQIRITANESLAGIDYDFRVCDSPTEMRDLILELDQGPDRARLVAGYCWDWISKQDTQRYDIAFPQHGFAMQWNLADDGQLWLLNLVLGSWSCGRGNRQKDWGQKNGRGRTSVNQQPNVNQQPLLVREML